MANNFNRDLYEILNVQPDASLAEIKASYRRLVRMYHPDSAGSDADVSKFKEVQEAYEILSKPSERQKYDIVYGYYTEKFKKDVINKREEAKKKFTEQIKKEREKAEKVKKEQNRQKREAERKETKTQERPERNENFSKSINDALDSLFHTKDKTFSDAEKEMQKPKIDGEDIHTEVSISVLEALKGAERKVNILHTEPCPSCSGRRFINEGQCSVCKGSGQLQTQKTISVKIPKGVKHGSKIRVKNEGGKGRNGGKDGSLYIIVNIEKSKYIETEGENVHINLPVTASEAALGADIQIDLIKEKVNVKIPPLTSSGQKLRLSGLGLENKDKTKRGDVIITVCIKMPEKLSEEEKALYEKLKEKDFDARKDFRNAK